MATVKLTITEALGEIKTILKKIESKRKFIGNHIMRQKQFTDPLENDGGSVKLIEQDMQAIEDLFKRMVAIRIAVQEANRKTKIAVGKISMTISEWLAWRKEVAPVQIGFYKHLLAGINSVRDEAIRNRAKFVSREQDATEPRDVIVHFSKKTLADRLESFETALTELDAQLSLKNATVTIEI